MFAVLSISGLWTADAQVNVTTQHNDIGRTGQNLSETTLTTSNVNPTQFGKLFSLPVDGEVYAQTLYLSGITINGAVHNVVFIATENDYVYAFDADTNGGSNASPLWQVSMLIAAHGAAAGATPISANTVGTQDISPELGITGTPVIDTSTDTLYVVSYDFENGGAVHRLHALSIFDGSEKFGGPVVVTGSVPGTGSGSVNGTLTFDPLWQNERPGLLLLNGIIYLAFGSNADNGPWHGWVFGYNAATLQQTGAFCTSPNGTGGGIWMAGTGLAADQLDPVNHPFGRLFVPTGNGDYNASSPYTSDMDYGDTDIDFDLTNGHPTVTDEFTTHNQVEYDAEDLDVASGGLMILPTQTTGKYPHLAVQTGKPGSLFLLNRDNLGGYNTTTDQVVQVLPNAVGVTGAWSTGAYWNGTVYYWGRIDHLKAFQLVNGLLSTTPTESTEEVAFPGSTPSISANGTTQGIVWTIDSESFGFGPAVLEAHDASNVSTTLYSSADMPARDTPGIAVKFTTPTIANGKVYVGTGGEVDIYGLLNSVTRTPAPTFSPGSESFAGSLNVSITDANPNASIYYTTNGSPATTAPPSILYTPGTPIPVSTDTTINAIASVSGELLSSQATAVFNSTTETQSVVFSQPTGTYTAVQLISLSDPTPNATIYYTADGSTPSTKSTAYLAGSPILVNATETITAIAIASGFTISPVAAATYTIEEGLTGINFPQGFGSSNGLVILQGSTDLDDVRLQLTNGLTGEAGSAWYYKPVDIQTFTTTFGYQLSNPNGNGITFTIQNSPAGVNALGGSGDSLGYAPISNSVAIKFDLYSSTTSMTVNSTGLYTNGTAPITPSIDLTSTPINLHSDDAVSVTLAYNGTTLNMTITDLVTTKVWSTSWNINIPATIGSTAAYVGFTGSTSNQTASQKILGWTYVNNYAPPFGLLERAAAGVTGATSDTLFVSGWIADPADGSPLSNVKVLLDGVSIGKPTLGVARPDIAAAQNNAAYGKSGFTMVYPTNLSAGSHSVSVVGVDSHGVMTTLGPLAVTVTAGSFGALEEAVDSKNQSGAIDSWDNLIVSGWIADPTDGSPMSNVKVLIDGVSVGAPTLGIARPDIAASYGDPAFAKSGFSLTYPGTSLAAGSHTVAVVGVNSHSVSTTLGPVTITARPPIGHLEEAIDDTTRSTTIAQGDTLYVGGWIADPTDGSPMSNVKVLIDGVSIGTPTLGISRPDVAAAQNNPAYGLSGFSLKYPAKMLMGGSHAVTVVGTNSHKVSATLGPITIIVVAPFGNLEHADDSIYTTQTIPLYDTLYVGGWIVDPIDGSPMSNVKVLIDGVSVGTPTLGLYRPDVATDHDNPAYAEAGFSFTYAASLMTPGPHAVTVVGVDSHSASVTLGPITIYVAPPQGNLEQAEDATTGSATIPTTDNLIVSGWIADPHDGSPMSNVKVLIDGVSIGTPTLGISRPDVATAHSDPAYGLSGFSMTYPAKSLVAGSHVVTVVGVDSLLMSTTLGPKTIAVTGPQISGISPNYGAPAALVTITGTGFGTTQGGGSVTVGGAPSYVVSWSNTSIAIQVPSRATTGSIVVTAGGGASNGAPFTFYSEPSITSLSVDSGPVGTSVTINGSNLLDGDSKPTVTFDGTPAAITSDSSGSIQVTVPIGATSGRLLVRVNGVTLIAAADFIVSP